ncbi:uncharacterized protein J4E88_009490 [Alternaria novae-zelandiae]|uniref:uncharacterized protein n=1 Tax=Alternaria novae-zelandiae TaxID=430562 RepID=UPI0020C4A366|nr:uncharacterized protein J4E88_009490 [Alternaria novae-zelandiae]KAI4671092.1 hypothetical protein J4E88_009490 [Alternaria novae-zelandiae]
MNSIVSPTLFRIVSAGYTIMNKANSALEYRALEYALYSVMTVRGTAITWRVINWLHIKLKTNVGLRKELEVAKKQQKESEMREKASSDRARQTTQVDEVPDFATPVREEPTQTPEVVRKLQEALKETSDQLKRSNAQVKELQQSTSKPAHPSRMSNSSHNSSTPKRDALEDMGHQLRAARQEAVDAKMEASSKDEQLRLVQEVADGAEAKVASLMASHGQEPQAVEAQVASLKAELEAARQETQTVNVELLSVKEQLGCANEAIKTAGSGLAQVKELVGKVQEEKDEAEANAASLTMQLQASREEEEKGRADAASMERDFHEVRLRHSKEVAALKEQVKEWEGIAAEAKEVNDNVQTALNDENEELKEQMKKDGARREALEAEVKKLKSEIDGTKATEMAAPASKSLTPSETQNASSAIYSNHPIDTQPRLISVAGLTSPSTPIPTTLSGPTTTPDTTSTPKNHKKLTADWNARTITLPAYIEGLDALKRKSDDEGETPRPIKQLRLSGENTDIPTGTLLTPGGGPAFKFAAQEPGQEEQGEDDGDASDIEDFWSSFEGDADNSGTFTYGLGDEVGAEAAALLEQDAAKGETNTHGDTLVIDGDTIIDGSDHSNDDLYAMPSPSPNKQPPPVISDIPDIDIPDIDIPDMDIPAIELTPATKRKIGIEGDEEASPKPSQVPRTKEDLGGEQTLALENMTPIAVTRKPAIILTPVMKRLFTDDDSEEPPRSSQMPPRLLQSLPKSSKVQRTKVDLGDEQTPTLDELVTENVVAASREGNETTEVSGTAQSLAENEGAPPEVLPAPTEEAEPNNTPTMGSTNETNAVSAASLAPPAPSQAPNNGPRLSEPVPASQRKTRNAGKPVGSLNENVLSKMAASPMKEEKETDTEKANARGKSPVKSTKSPAKKTVKSPAKAPERSRASEVDENHGDENEDEDEDEDGNKNRNDMSAKKTGVAKTTRPRGYIREARVYDTRIRSDAVSNTKTLTRRLAGQCR